MLPFMVYFKQTQHFELEGQFVYIFRTKVNKIPYAAAALC